MKRQTLIILLFVLHSSIFTLCEAQPALHLTQTINYGKHITDIEFSKEPPYAPHIYVYKIHPAEREAVEVVMGMSADEDTTTVKPVYVPPKPEVEYAVQVPGIKDSLPGGQTSFNLGAGEFCWLINTHEMITEDMGDSIFRKYSITPTGLRCTDSLFFPSSKMGSSASTQTTPDGRFYLTQKMVPDSYLDSSTINFYDSALHKIATIKERQPESNVTFVPLDPLQGDGGKALILNWRKQIGLLNLKEYSLAQKKISLLSETEFPIAEPTDEWSIGSLEVCDTMVLIKSQMYDSRETMVYAFSPSVKVYGIIGQYDAKLYWEIGIDDYADDINILKGANEMVCTFYDTQAASTIKFYSLKTGKWEHTINLNSLLSANTKPSAWLVYLPIHTIALPGGKWIACLVNEYSPDNTDVTRNYLVVSNGTTTLKSKFRKSKSITSNMIIPLSPTKLAVVLDDDIYYYSIY